MEILLLTAQVMQDSWHSTLIAAIESCSQWEWQQQPQASRAAACPEPASTAQSKTTHRSWGNRRTPADSSISSWGQGIKNSHTVPLSGEGRVSLCCCGLEVSAFVSAGVGMGVCEDLPWQASHNSPAGTRETSHSECLRTFTKFIISWILLFKPSLISCKKHMGPCYNEATQYF